MREDAVRNRRHESPSWQARALLGTAIVASLFVSVAVSIALWSLYETTYASPGSARSAARISGQPLDVGVARTPGGPREWITFAKVLARMQRDLGRQVLVHYALSSDEQIRLFENGEIDVALMSTLAYLDVDAEGLVTTIATPMVLGQSTDVAVMVVSSRSTARRIEDLKGLRFAVSADLAGASFTCWLLTQHGYDPVGFFSETTTGVQHANLAQVARGTVDGTSVRRSAITGWPEGTFRIIEQSEPLGMPPIVARASLETTVVDVVRKSLLTAAERNVIPSDSAITGFRPATSSEYAFARTLDAVDRNQELAAFGIAHQ